MKFFAGYLARTHLQGLAGGCVCTCADCRAQMKREGFKVPSRGGCSIEKLIPDPGHGGHGKLNGLGSGPPIVLRCMHCGQEVSREGGDYNGGTWRQMRGIWEHEHSGHWYPALAPPGRRAKRRKHRLDGLGGKGDDRYRLTQKAMQARAKHALTAWSVFAEWMARNRGGVVSAAEWDKIRNMHLDIEKNTFKTTVEAVVYRFYRQKLGVEHPPLPPLAPTVRGDIVEEAVHEHMVNLMRALGIAGGIKLDGLLQGLEDASSAWQKVKQYALLLFGGFAAYKVAGAFRSVPALPAPKALNSLDNAHVLTRRSDGTWE